MFTKITATFLVILFGLSFVIATEVGDCDGGIPQPIHVDIKGCDRPPCELPRGQTVVMLMNFTAPVPIDRLRASVIAQPDGSTGTVPFPLPAADVCGELTNTHCPLEVNEPAMYKLQMPVLRIYPKIGVHLEFSIRHNGGGDKLVCFEVDCQVV